MITRKRVLILGWLLVLALASALPLSAVFHGIVHLGPGSLTFARRVDRPVFALGSDVTMMRGSSSPVFALLGNVRVEGTVDDDVVTVDGRIYLDEHAHVKRDVLSVLGGVYRRGGARVDGRIGGALHSWNGNFRPAPHDVGGAALRNVRLGLAAGLALLLVGSCLVIVFPWQVVLIATTLRDAPVKSVAAGLLGLLVFVFLVVPLGLSLAGLPFALLLTGAGALAWLFGIAAAAVVLGRTVARGPVSLIWASAAGLLALALAMSVPFVGPLLVTATGLAGAGALAVALVGRAYPVTPLR